MAKESEKRERAFRKNVQDTYDALRPLADAAFERVLLRFGPTAATSDAARPPRVTQGIAIQNIGRPAGKCSRDGRIVVNSQLIDYPEEVRATIAHELAHAVLEAARRSLLAGHARWRMNRTLTDVVRRRGDWSTHGAAWRMAAIELGDGGDRCHRLPLKPVRRLRRFLYRADCGAELQLTTVRHNRLQRNRRLYYLFGKDRVRISGRHFVGEVEPGA